MARTDWESAYLRALGAPNTPANRRFLAAWQRWEGGHTNNDARFNYLNTTQRMKGSSSINSVGVQRYSSLQQGAQAFAQTLRNGRYADIVQALRAGDPYHHNVTGGLSTWLSGSPDSEAGHRYAAKVLGLNVAPPPMTPMGSAPSAATASGPPDLSSARMNVVGQLASGHFDPFQSLQALTDSLMAGGHLAAAPGANGGRTARVSRGSVPGGGIQELFYDPLGGIKMGHEIGAIGHHSDHVHVSLSTEAAQKAAIAQAQRMGLHVGEDMNGNVHPVHVHDSYHYRHYRKGDPLREAADVSGSAKLMAAYYRWVQSHYGRKGVK